jgi:uncharacterized protein (DUF305 family)
LAGNASPSVDYRDFAAIMIPHHQATIDMAEAELKYGHDDELRRLAEKIVAQQQQEILILRRATEGTAVAPPPPGTDLLRPRP